MTRRDILAFLFRWKATIVGWWLFIVALTTLLVFLLPPAYVASTSVLIERTRAPVISQDRLEAPDMIEAMNTEAQIVSARPVIESVIEELDLNAADGKREPESLSGRVKAWMVDVGLSSEVPAYEGWVESISELLAVTPSVDSNVLRISFASSDPVFAMRVVNAVTESYIAHRRSIFSSSEASAYFRDKMQEAGAELERLRGALTDFKASHNLTAVQERQAQLVRDSGALRDRVAGLQRERSDLRTRFDANHPRVQVLTQAIAEAEREIARHEEELKALEGSQSTIDDLTMMIASQEDLVREYKSRYEDERVREAAPEALVNVQVIEYAATPARPKRDRLFFIKAALVGGLALAILIAFLREYFDSRIRSPEEVESALGVPVVGSIGQRRSLKRT